MPEMRAEGLGIEGSDQRMARLDQPVAQGFYVRGADFAASADDVEASIHPGQRELGIGCRVEIMTGMQNVHRAAMLERAGLR